MGRNSKSQLLAAGGNGSLSGPLSPQLHGWHQGVRRFFEWIVTCGESGWAPKQHEWNIEQIERRDAHSILGSGSASRLDTIR